MATSSRKLMNRAFGAGLLLAATMMTPAHAEQTGGEPISELEQLRRDAQQARKDAEAALKKALAAEEAIARMLAQQNETPPQSFAGERVIAAATSACPPPESGSPNRLDCIAAEPPRPNSTPPSPEDWDRYRSATRGLMAYAVDPNAETSLREYLNEDSSGGKVNFAHRFDPVASRFSTTKGQSSVDLAYELPLSRRRNLTMEEDGIWVRPVTHSLTFRAAATIDKNDKSGNSGLIGQAGSFNDDPLKFSVSYGRQYYPKSRVYGQGGGDIENRAKLMVDALVEKCKAALKPVTSAFNPPPTKGAASLPSSCSGTDLLQWAFDPARAEDYKANIAAYNAAFWNPPEKKLPEYGWGITPAVSRQNFKYILPTAFPAGTIVEGSDPPLLSTLLFRDKDGIKPDLGGQEDLRYSFEVGGYVFRHFAAPTSWIDGITVKPSATVARRWSIDTASSDVEFCALKAVATPGANNRECKKFHIAAPEAKWAFEPALNVRARLKLPYAYFPQLGFSPTIAFSTATDQYRLTIPAYLAADKDGVLTGGVQFSRQWGGDEDSKSIWSIFLSTPLAMEGQK